LKRQNLLLENRIKNDFNQFEKEKKEKMALDLEKRIVNNQRKLIRNKWFINRVRQTPSRQGGCK
jgi:hypothetical protein